MRPIKISSILADSKSVVAVLYRRPADAQRCAISLTWLPQSQRQVAGQDGVFTPLSETADRQTHGELVGLGLVLLGGKRGIAPGDGQCDLLAHGITARIVLRLAAFGQLVGAVNGIVAEERRNRNRCRGSMDPLDPLAGHSRMSM